MSDLIIKILYMIFCIFFIRGIKLLGKTDTARRGNLYSSIGMLIAIVTVLCQNEVLGSWNTEKLLSNGYIWIATAVISGSVVGSVWSKKVEMTGMPQLVALFNGFGGLSSLLVALTQYLVTEKGDVFTSVSLGLTIAIGAVAFTGSIVAWGKLSGKAFKKNVSIPAKNVINAGLFAIGLVSIAVYSIFRAENPFGLMQIEFYGIALTAVSFLVLGFTLVIPIGGGDMPVIISFLNALSGLAAAFAGFAINNTVLVVSGCLVGASGLILTMIMC